MNTSRIKSIVATVGLIAGGILVVGAPAQADDIGSMPSGCYISASTPDILSSEDTRIVYGGSASCSSASSIDFRLVHNYSGLPDARVAEVNIPLSSADYHGLTCDNGPATTEYYSELAFRGLSSTVQRISPTVTLSHC